MVFCQETIVFDGSRRFLPQNFRFLCLLVVVFCTFCVIVIDGSP